MNNLGGIKVNGHNIFGTDYNKDSSEVWIIKKLENTDHVQILNKMTKMCLSNEGFIQINLNHKIRYCNKRNPDQYFFIRPVKFD